MKQRDSRPAPLWRRFAAMAYDLIVLAGLWMLTAGVCLALTAGHMDVHHPPWWQRLLLLGVTAAYFVLSWVRGGQTVGMRPWRLIASTTDGRLLRPAHALARFFAALASLLLLGAGFWWAIIDPQKRTLHDRLCGTTMRLM